MTVLSILLSAIKRCPDEIKRLRENSSFGATALGGKTQCQPNVYCAVPFGTRPYAFSTRHFRAGLRAVPSLRDSSLCLFYPGTSVPGSRLCRPYGNSSLCLFYPALPCRALGCAVPTGLVPMPFLPGTSVPGSRLCRPLRDSSPSLFYPGTSVPGSGLCRPLRDSSLCLF